jgi:hypothetical protein
MSKAVCSKQIKLRGLFVYTVRTARDLYLCFYCNKAISPGAVYIEERFPGAVRRYHYKCFNRVMPHKLVAVETASGVLLCTSQT